MIEKFVELRNESSVKALKRIAVDRTKITVTYNGMKLTSDGTVHKATIVASDKGDMEGFERQIANIFEGVVKDGE